MALEQTWRWFGPSDPVSLREIKQTGATGVVTALHQVPTGEVWPIDDILRRKALIEAEDLRWSVAESVSVHEDIKRRSGAFRRFTQNYCQTIRHLGQCGVDTVCYNFMPVLDWSRTDLRVGRRDGSITTGFQTSVFAAFDLFILKRPGAEESYPQEVLRDAARHHSGLTSGQRRRLLETVLLGLPGSGEAYSLNQFRQALSDYKDVGQRELRDHLYAFIHDIIPVAEEAGVLMALHPDDPPWPLLGLPRVVSSASDLEEILKVVDSLSNGLTLCTGSLGASIHNDIVSMTQQFAARINFLHLRNVRREACGDFVEEDHLHGDVNMAAVMKLMILDQRRRNHERARNARLPFRPDHGHLMVADRLKPPVYPGYSLFGRMRALAELRGLELGIRHSLPRETDTDILSPSE